MIRALTTLVGLAAAAAILYFVTDVGDGGGSWWSFALVWAAAGFVLGLLYQAGGRRAPGVRMNLPMLILAFLPWTVLTAALVAIQAGKPVWLADRGRDILPDGWIGRWEISLPAFALGTGLLLAFSLIEPRVGIRERVEVADTTTAPVEAYTPYVPAEPPYAPDEPAYTPVTAVQPAVGGERETVVRRNPDTTETVVSHDQRAIDERPTTRLISEGSADDREHAADVENPVQVIHPEREGRSDA
jgi:hypothetical protein